MIYFNAFWVGGLICVIGQILIDKTKLTSARILVAFVTAGVILSAVGLYQPLVDFAGGGASVPLLGFGHSLAKGAIRGAEEKGLLGALAGGLRAGAAGISAAVLFGYLNALVFRSRSKS